jgi:hypothetical protein
MIEEQIRQWLHEYCAHLDRAMDDLLIEYALLLSRSGKSSGEMATELLQFLDNDASLTRQFVEWLQQQAQGVPSSTADVPSSTAVSSSTGFSSSTAVPSTAVPSTAVPSTVPSSAAVSSTAVPSTVPASTSNATRILASNTATSIFNASSDKSAPGAAESNHHAEEKRSKTNFIITMTAKENGETIRSTDTDEVCNYYSIYITHFIASCRPFDHGSEKENGPLSILAQLYEQGAL